MVRINRVYTRTGDDGSTGLGGGERRPKYDLRIKACGSVDETNASIGVARLHLADTPDLNAALGLVQNDMFDLGADLAVPNPPPGQDKLTIQPAQTARLEADIDRFNARLNPLTSFILPGGSPASAYLHAARTICRRTERIVVELAARPEEAMNPEVVHYLNRLSDLLFVAARVANDNGATDVLWIPGQNR